jgi:hypothetical protein
VEQVVCLASLSLQALKTFLTEKVIVVSPSDASEIYQSIDYDQLLAMDADEGGSSDGEGTDDDFSLAAILLRDGKAATHSRDSAMDLCRVLRSHGIPPTWQDAETGDTAAIIAANTRNWHLLRLIAQSPSALSKRNKKGESVMHAVCRVLRDKKDCGAIMAQFDGPKTKPCSGIEFLLKKGAPSLLDVDHRSRTPLLLVCQWTTTKQGGDTLLRVLRKCGVRLRTSSEVDMALSHAIWSHDIDFLRALLDGDPTIFGAATGFDRLTEVPPSWTSLSLPSKPSYTAKYTSYGRRANPNASYMWRIS